MKLEHLLLGILLIKPRTGYEISRYMEMEGVFMRPRTHMSQVYRSLAQMAERGWVSFAVSTRPGAQDAKIYRTTPVGRDVFMSWLTSDYRPTLEAVNYEFRARMFFSGFLGPDALLALIEIEIDARKRQISKYRYRDRTIEADPDSSFDIELVTLVEDHHHEGGTAAMDVMIGRLEKLHELITEHARRGEATDAGNQRS
ncbi:PadR family transcriptional regulator AphA [Microbacterium natoriense]|uniref:PadR family transcriptional regulator AphA n=1 Tax=Microbacterium natoriense TaxID=284570 RepID=A0AAW8ETP7_9MICO|nr:helix-turn-helix transcriptional regulator [Microbacterium natoriense]MDQ0646239.1 PadR family transcriptional regulator AphA [Microbacterium natoriense]